MLRLLRRSGSIHRVAFLLTLVSLYLTGCSKLQNSNTTSGRTVTLAGGQQFGAPPPTEVEPVDIYATYRLPRLRDQPSGPLNGYLKHLHLIARARDLGIISRSPVRAWEASSSLAHLSEDTERSASGEVAFNGSNASELNRLLSTDSVKAVRVTSSAVTVDEPISITRSDLRLDLGAAAIRGKSSLNYLVRIQKGRRVEVRGGVFLAGDSGFLIDDSQRVRISGATIRGLSGTGIVVTGSSAVVVRGSHISGLRYAGIVVHRGVTGSLVEENRIEGNTGTSNLAAAVLLTDREVDLAADSRSLYGPDAYRVVQQSLAKRRHPPSGNLIRNNDLERNQGPGIYSDGGVRNVIVSNRIVGNAKQGICLDNGSMANIVAANVVRRNGERWGEPDAVLRMENVAGKGRLPDGTPAAKLPGISLDNALYNIVFQNTVVDNYGGAVKLVRTGLLNVVGLNTLIANAQETGEPPHFFGIELGAAGADAGTGELDVTPARGNMIFSNLIRGPHYAGIHFAEGSDLNDLFDNVVMDASKWAFESARPMLNITTNNLTNLPSRNIGPGINPNLFVVGQPVMDRETAGEKSAGGSK